MAVWTGLEQLTKMVAKIKAMPDKLGDEIVESVKPKTPSVTGTLRNGWESEVNAGVIVVGNDVIYAPFVEYGTPTEAPVGMLGTTALEVPGMIDKLLGTDR